MQRNPQPNNTASRQTAQRPPQQRPAAQGQNRPVQGQRPVQSQQRPMPQSRPAAPQRPVQSRPAPSQQTRPMPQSRPVQPQRPAQSRPPHSQQTRPMPQSRPAQPPRPSQQRPPMQQPVQKRVAPGSIDVFLKKQDTQPLIISAASVAALFVIYLLLQYVIFPGGYFPSENKNDLVAVAEFSSSRGVRINEVMTSNKTVLSTSDGDYPDWIELMNTSSAAVDITGWALVDKTTRSTYFVFPQYSLDPGETVIVFASGHLRQENGSDFHAPFRLSSAGDTLMLSDAHGTVIESINIPALGANQSYAHANGGWSITSEYTPSLPNTSESYVSLTSTQPVGSSSLLITEIMADNASFPASDGVLYDWIEIQNVGSAPVNLAGCSLSDDPTKPAQWKFPDVTVQPGQCIVVYASGLNTVTANGEMHANFGLRAEGEAVLLYNGSNQVLDHVEYDNLKADQSMQRRADGSYENAKGATPGQNNG